MNIDTLNAYCGIELVSVPYLAQGRFYIHRTEYFLSAQGCCFASGSAQLYVLSCEFHRLDSWERSWVVVTGHMYTVQDF